MAPRIHPAVQDTDDVYGVVIDVQIDDVRTCHDLLQAWASDARGIACEARIARRKVEDGIDIENVLFRLLTAPISERVGPYFVKVSACPSPQFHPTRH